MQVYTESLESLNILPFVEIFMIIGLLVYIVFSLVVIRQIQLMTNTIEVGFEFPVKLLGIANLVFAIIVFIFALSIL